MIFEVEREIRHALIIGEKDLLNIFSLIKRKYKEVNTSAKCNDGITIKSKDINEIVEFENHDFRKIESIFIEGINSKEEILFLEIKNKGFLSTTAKYSAKSKNEEELNHILVKLNELFLGAKPWYNFLTNISIPLIFLSVGILIIYPIVFLRIYFKIVGRIPQDTATSSLLIGEKLAIAVFFVLLIYFIANLLNKLNKWLFPKMFFLIGKQKEEMEKIRSVRKILFISIFIALVICIVADLFLRIF